MSKTKVYTALVFIFLFFYGYTPFGRVFLLADDKKNPQIKQINKAERLPSYFREQVNDIIGYQKNAFRANKLKLDVVPDNAGWMIKIYHYYLKIGEALKNERYDEVLEVINKNKVVLDFNLIRKIIIEHIKNSFVEGRLDLKSENLFILVKRFPKLYKESPLLLDLYKSQKNKYLQLEIVGLIARYGNFSRVPKDLELKTKRFLKNPTILVSHFNSQFKYRNQKYLLNAIPEKLANSMKNGFSQNQISEIENLYIKLLIQKKHYSKLLKLLNKKLYFKTISLDKKQEIELDLLLRKGFVKQISKKILADSTSGLVKNNYLRRIGDYFYNKREFKSSVSYYQKIDFTKISNFEVSEIQWRILFSSLNQNPKNLEKIREISDWADQFKFDEKEDAARFCYWKEKIKKATQIKTPHLCYDQYPETFYGLKALVDYRDLGKTKNLDVRYYFKKNNPIPNLDQMLKRLYLDHQEDLAEYMIRRLFYEHNNLVKNTPDVFELLNRFKQYNLLISLNDHYFQDIKLLGSKHIYRDILTTDFPLAYPSIVKQLQAKFNLPVYLIEAVMREESKLKVDAESMVGAQGLMQIMPSTGAYLRKIYKKKGLLDLKNPGTNIELGAFYLKRLLNRYKGNFYFTLAAYNAGPTNANRWRKKIKQKGQDYFLESITYSETRNYIKRVMKTYFIYRILYEK